VIKTNLCVYPPALGLVLEAGLPSVGAPTLRYGEAPKERRELTQAEECAEWLVDVLAMTGEPVKPKEIVRLAAEEGFTQGVVYRARKALEGTVVDTAGKRTRDNRWALADEG
jgi:hypothetical protein